MGRSGYVKVSSSGGVLKSEKKRWAVLEATQLSFFKDKGKDRVESIQLGDAKVASVEKKKKPAIEVTVTVATKPKVYTIVPEESDTAEWLADLQSAASGKGAGKKMSEDDFELMNLIGKGSFGKVMQVKKKDTGEIYAMKVLSKKHIVANNEVEHTKSERNILERLNHPFLVNMVFSFQTDEKLYFILEFVNGGELFHHLQKEKRFSEERVRFYSAEILCAIEYLHENGVVYRDLKPENLLLTDSGHIVLTDFGLCKEGMERETDRTGTFCGTPEYLAPEVLKGQGYTKTVDWWSYGSLVYEMLTGLPPFYSQDVQEMYRKIMTEPLKFPDIVSKPAKALLKDLLIRDLSKRLVDVEKIKKYDFFSTIDWEKLLAKEIPPPYVPKVKGKEDVGQVDTVFLEEKPSLDLGDDDEPEMEPGEAEGAFDGFTFENTSAIGAAK